MSKHPTTGFDLDEVDRLLTTTKQVRQRLDLTRPVPADELLECIEIASHAPMGGNLERNRWLIVNDADLKSTSPNGSRTLVDLTSPRTPRSAPMTASQRVIDSASSSSTTLPRFRRCHRAAPRPSAARPIDAGRRGGLLRLGASGRVELPARGPRARGIGSAWTTFHLEHEAEIAELLGVPPTVTQVCLLAVGYYTGETFAPAPRRAVREITFLNRWKHAVG